MASWLSVLAAAAAAAMATPVTAAAVHPVHKAAADVRTAQEALRAAEAQLHRTRAHYDSNTDAATAASGRPVPQELPFLFMDLEDVQDPWGMMWPQAGTMAPDLDYQPPALPYTSGATVIGVLPARDFESSGEWEVYASNTTGWEPLGEPETEVMEEPEPEPEPEPEGVSGGPHPKYPECGRGATCPVSLLRYTTTNFRTYSAPHLSLFISDTPVGSGGTPTVKSIARNDETGLYVLFACYHGSCSHTFTSTTRGLNWTLCNITGVVSPGKAVAQKSCSMDRVSF